jgi:hypothetical protein
VIRSGIRGALCAGVAATAFFAVVPLAQADSIDLKLGGSVKNQLADAGSNATLSGTVNPSGPGQQVTIKATVGKDLIFTRQLQTKTQGDFQISFPVRACCQYKLTAATPTASNSIAFNVGVPKKMHQGAKGDAARLLNDALRDQGYYVHAKKSFNASTGLALLAFRKVNKLDRNEKYSKGIFKTLLEGKGAFPLQHPDEGKHVEADLSRQVLVLADDGEPQYTFPISSGAPATRTVLGHYEFYLKTPGYNAKQMYYSAYFIRGYATHGYHSVPNYPASHGCLRNPIPDSKFIYNWINIGDDIWVYS